ncbi:ZZ type zinc finger domain-containing protein [Plectosphaerella plurivora]|uniref:ZZ type zinc finger domain-containing protein n=1 Tax=Plectosphaerella plurivora TaxID=936078 RepID=A0A9P8VM06_9PEZI|nr:ZZ type zinc finger domain-containing protein [Plectosphaerella plurivora]
MPSELEYGVKPKKAAPQPPPRPNFDDLPVTLKVNFEDFTRRHKLCLRDMGAATLEPKVRQFLDVSPDTELLLERYSDSAGAYITLDDKNPAVYKQLYRAAKAKQKLKLRVTKKSPHLQNKQTPQPASVEDESETPAPLPTPQAEPAAETQNKRSTIFDVLRTAEPSSASTSTGYNPSAPLPASDTGFDFETSLLTSLMNRHNIGPDGFEPERSQTQQPRDIPVAHGSDARDEWFTRAASSGLGSSLFPARIALSNALSYAVCCNSCDKNIPDTHYHCSTCDDGDFDLCQSCVDKGISCHGNDHWLIKRVLKDGQIVTSTTETIAPKPKAKKQEPVPEPKLTLLDDDVLETSPFNFRTFSLRTCNCCVNDFAEHNFLHCAVCEDFDLCQTCFSKDAHGHNPKHAFLPAVAGSYVPNHIKIRLASGRNQMHHAICDGCDKYITGVRHKCLDCPDWDYCGECVLNAKFVHAGHRFAPLYEPLEELRNRSATAQTHYGICCDGPLCTKSGFISGVRYKCTICHDTDFCANCEASPANHHNKTHPMVKFKTPVRHCTVATVAERCDGHTLPQMGDRGQPPARPRAADQASVQTVQTVVDMEPIESPLVQEPVVEKVVEKAPEPIEEKFEIKTKIEAEVDAEVKAEETPAPAPARDLVAVFVRDTVADGTVLPPSHGFEQTWYLRNDGEVAWPAGCAVKFVGGDYMGHLDPNQPAGISELVSASESITCYEALAPGKEFAFTVLLRTPAREGKHISYWRLTTAEGLKFGHRLWCDVKVKAPKVVETPKAEIKEEPKEIKEEPKEASDSQMIFPKLEKESPISSIYQDNKDAKSETASTAVADEVEEVDDFDDCGDAEWDDSENAFSTDDEYDILDASDEEYLEEQQKKLRK